MSIKALLEKYLKRSKVFCQEMNPLEDDLLDIEAEENREATAAYLPAFRELLMPLRVMLMEEPGMAINGFLFSLAYPSFGPFFKVQHQIAMTAKRNPREGNMMAEMMQGGRYPFYAVNAMYNHFSGSGASLGENVFSLMGRIDSAAQVQTVFTKPLGRMGSLRLVGAFPNANPQLANLIAEMEIQQNDSKYGAQVNFQSADVFLMQRLGRRFVFGTQFNYEYATNAVGNSFVLRYTHSPVDRFYVGVGEGSAALSLGYIAKLAEGTSTATCLEFSGESMETSVGLGYRRRQKEYEVNSSVKTSGEMKTLFKYHGHKWLRFKLFLSGNLFVDDFKTGYSISVFDE